MTVKERLKKTCAVLLGNWFYVWFPAILAIGWVLRPEMWKFFLFFIGLTLFIKLIRFPKVRKFIDDTSPIWIIIILAAYWIMAPWSHWIIILMIIGIGIAILVFAPLTILMLVFVPLMWISDRLEREKNAP